VKELTDAGMSQRDAAAPSGVAHTTVQRDLARSVPESGTERAASDRDDRREAAIVGNEALAQAEVLEPTQTFETIVLADNGCARADAMRPSGRGRLVTAARAIVRVGAKRRSRRHRRDRGRIAEMLVEKCPIAIHVSIV
jgi:hypothetical protein